MTEPSLTLKAMPGNRTRLGATVRDGGVNFAVASTIAESVAVCLFDADGRETRFDLDDYDAGVWHGFVPDVGPGQAYGYRAVRAGQRPALQPEQAAPRPLRPRDRRRRDVRPGAARP